MSYDFRYAMTDSGIDAKVADSILRRFQKFKKPWFECIDASFIRNEQKEQFKALIHERLNTLLK